jgi:choline-sulfatase
MATRPNILFILSDDQGIWAAGCYGNPEIRTPNLDRIAAGGMRFDNFFVASPVCSPSRATFLTGRICSQHGVHDWIREGNVGDDAACYLKDEVAYTDILAAHGWTCGLSGKWHLGHSQLPQHGFSHWFTHQQGGGPYNDAPMIRNGELVNEPGYVTNVITDDALGFIERHANDDAPFYLGVHYTAPHSPWTGHPQAIVDSYDDCPFASCPQEPIHPWAVGHPLTENSLGNRDMLKGYFAAVTAMDEDIGRLLDQLDTLGISDNTLVVFVSDNGFSCGHHGFWGKGNATYPPNMFDNSVKVPMLMRHPGRIPAATVQTGLCSAYDFMPTLLDYLELPRPTGRDLPGQSFLPLLQGQETPVRDNIVVYDEYGATRMARTTEWKYVHRYAAGPHELYDLKNDADERHNLADDPNHSARVSQMLELLEQWFNHYVEADKNGRDYPITGKGQLRPVGNAWTNTTPPFAQE